MRCSSSYCSQTEASEGMKSSMASEKAGMNSAWLIAVFRRRRGATRRMRSTLRR